MILSSLTSKTNPGKKYGRINSLNSYRLLLKVKAKSFLNHSKSLEPIPSKKKLSALLLGQTKNPQKHKSSQVPILIHLQTKNTAWEWNSKITTMKTTHFTETSKVFWEINTRKMTCWFIWKDKTKKTSKTTVEQWSKVVKRWSFICPKHSSLWIIRF